MTLPGTPIPPHLTPAGRAEKLVPAAMGVLAAICVTGLVGLVAAAFPPAFAEQQWRLRVAGLALSTAPQLAFLLTMIAVAGVYGGHHAAVRATSVALFLMAAGIVIILPFFALDFLAQRHVQSQAAIGAFTRDGLRLGACTAFLVPFLIWAGVRSWTESRKGPGAELGVGHGLVVGQGG